MKSNFPIRCFAQPQFMAQTLAKEMVELAQGCHTAERDFHLVLAGGTTPQLAYGFVAQQSASWQSWQLYHGDERCVDALDPQRNSLMVHQAWLSQVDFPQANHHQARCDLTPDQAAQAYAEIMPRHDFDLVLLGMGEDGHTASLFPGHPQPEGVDVFVEYQSPKPPALRISLSAARLARTQRLIALVSGSGKHSAFAQLLAGEALPLLQVMHRAQNHGAQVELWCDEAALGSLALPESLP